MTDDTVTSHFRCSDCGADVHAFGLTVCLVPPLCNVCAWFAAEFQDDPVEREAVRAALEQRTPSPNPNPSRSARRCPS